MEEALENYLSENELARVGPCCHFALDHVCASCMCGPETLTEKITEAEFLVCRMLFFAGSLLPLVLTSDLLVCPAILAQLSRRKCPCAAHRVLQEVASWKSLHLGSKWARGSRHQQVLQGARDVPSRAQRWRRNSHVIEEGGPKSWWKSSRWERDDDAQSSQDRQNQSPLEIEHWLASKTNTSRSTSTSTQEWLAPSLLHDSMLNYVEDVNQQTPARSTSAGIPQKRMRFGDDVALWERV